MREPGNRRPCEPAWQDGHAMTKGNIPLRHRVTKRQAGITTASRGRTSAVGSLSGSSGTSHLHRPPASSLAQTDGTPGDVLQAQTLIRGDTPWPGRPPSQGAPFSRGGEGKRKGLGQEKGPHWRPPRQAGKTNRTVGRRIKPATRFGHLASTGPDRAVGVGMCLPARGGREGRRGGRAWGGTTCLVCGTTAPMDGVSCP